MRGNHSEGGVKVGLAPTKCEDLRSSHTRDRAGTEPFGRRDRERIAASIEPKTSNNGGGRRSERSPGCYDCPVRRRKGATAGILAGLGVLALAAMSVGMPDSCGLGSEAVIGPEGGVVISEDGRLSLEVPEGALSEPTEVFVEAVPCEAEGLADCYAVGGDGVQFSRPVTVVYEAGELESMDRVALLYKGSSGWIRMPDAQIDREDEIVMGTIMVAASISVDAR